MVSEKDTRECLQLHERELEKDITVLPAAGQHWVVGGVEGALGEAEGEEVGLACLRLRYLQRTMYTLYLETNKSGHPIHPL